MGTLGSLGGQAVEFGGREGGACRAHHLPAEPAGHGAQRGNGSACVGSVVQRQGIASGGGRGSQAGRGQTGGVQAPATEGFEAVDVVYGFAGHCGFDAAGVGVPAGGKRPSASRSSAARLMGERLPFAGADGGPWFGQARVPARTTAAVTTSSAGQGPIRRGSTFAPWGLH